MHVDPHVVALLQQLQIGRLVVLEVEVERFDEITLQALALVFHTSPDFIDLLSEVVDSGSEGVDDCAASIARLLSDDRSLELAHGLRHLRPESIYRDLELSEESLQTLHVLRALSCTLLKNRDAVPQLPSITHVSTESSCSARVRTLADTAMRIIFRS